MESAALAVIPVLTGNEWDSSMAVEGFQHKPSETPDPHMQFISPDYFKTMNVPILLGRDFRMTDGRGAPEVCIVNEKFARRYFKDGLAVGTTHRNGRRSGHQAEHRDRRRGARHQV